MANLLFLNGPNLNCLGQRETQFYGEASLAEINKALAQQAKTLGHEFNQLQSNSEATLICRIQDCSQDSTDFIIFNPAAFTHSSIALRDALLAVGLPFIEVHLSNIMAREPFRQHSYFSDIAVGTISGFGSNVYRLALDAADHYFTA